MAKERACNVRIKWSMCSKVKMNWGIIWLHVYIFCLFSSFELWWKLLNRKCVVKLPFPAFNNAPKHISAAGRWYLKDEFISQLTKRANAFKSFKFTGSQIQTPVCDCDESLNHTTMRPCCLYPPWGHVLLISSKHTIMMPAVSYHDDQSPVFVWFVHESHAIKQLIIIIMGCLSLCMFLSLFFQISFKRDSPYFPLTCYYVLLWCFLSI